MAGLFSVLRRFEMQGKLIAVQRLALPPALTDRLNDAAILPWLITGLRWAFLTVLALLALLALLARQRSARGRPIAPWLSFGIPLLFGLVWLHQGWWQLAGFTQPQFMRFLRRYDRRPDAAEVRPIRGRILDARGEPLAFDDPAVPGQRRYPLGAAVAHPVGFLHPRFGSFGLESVADAWLSGYALATPEERRRFGQNLIGLDRVRGNDLRLTIVANLQRAVADLLIGQRGAIVVLRPADGAVLALVSAPAFDPEDPSAALAADPEEAPMVNRALLGLYPPGSTFKIATAGLALENGFRGSLDCPGEGFVPQAGTRPIRDHEFYAALREGRVWAGHGRLDLREAFVKSSNVFFAQVGTRIPPAQFADLGRRLRLEEAWVVFEGPDGRIATRAVQGLGGGEWGPGRRAQVAIGQGSLLVTPLHMAVLAGAVANEGLAWQPRLWADAEPVGLGRFFKRDTARILRTLMLDVVRRGTGRRAAVEGIEVAGKTGTAQNPRGADHAWFAGFAPFERPTIAFAVLVEHGGSGGVAAAPLAARLVRAAAEQGLLDGPERRTGP